MGGLVSRQTCLVPGHIGSRVGRSSRSLGVVEPGETYDPVRGKIPLETFPSIITVFKLRRVFIHPYIFKKEKEDKEREGSQIPLHCYDTSINPLFSICKSTKLLD